MISNFSEQQMSWPYCVFNCFHPCAQSRVAHCLPELLRASSSMLDARDIPNSISETRGTDASESPSQDRYTPSWNNFLGLSLEGKQL